MARPTQWILACLLGACGFGGPDNDTNVVPIDASSGESGDPGFECGDIECGEGEVCIEDEPQDENNPPSRRCAATVGCPVSPPDCSCVQPLCMDGRECAPLGLMVGQLFSCEQPAP